MDRLKLFLTRKLQNRRYISTSKQAILCFPFKHDSMFLNETDILAGTSLARLRNAFTNSDLCRVISISGTRGLIGMRGVQFG